MPTKSRSAISGKYVSKAKAKAAPKTTVTESTSSRGPIGVATLTINTDGMTDQDRSRLSSWLINKAWLASKGPKTYAYVPAKWQE